MTSGFGGGSSVVVLLVGGGGGVVVVLVAVVLVGVVVPAADLDKVGSFALAEAASAAPSVCVACHGAPMIHTANTSRLAATTPSAVGIPHAREECARCRPAIAFLEFQRRQNPAQITNRIHRCHAKVALDTDQ
ncbi:hypothetical protein [Saccharomonospora marina]